MCAVQDTRDEGLERVGDMRFEFVEKVLDECSPYQPLEVTQCFGARVSGSAFAWLRTCALK